ncbi:hypothetical protein ACLOJK_008349 [Asimina triloba]
MSLYGRNNDDITFHAPPTNLKFSYNVNSEELEFQEIHRHAAPDRKQKLEKSAPSQIDKQSVHTGACHLMHKLLNKNEEGRSSVSRNSDSSDSASILSDGENSTSEPSASCTFEEELEKMQADEVLEMPDNLPGGVLLDQMYAISPKDLNTLLFAPNSPFKKDLAELQGTTDMQDGPWTWQSGDISSLRRVLTYVKAATKLVKAVKAIEEQVYLKADGKEFAVLISVNTPDVPYGSYFKVELIYKIMPGPELPSGEEISRLIISWNISFSQGTVMKGMIERGAQQGLEESYKQFADLLAQNIKPVDPAEVLVDKKQALASLQMEHHSDWELAIEYFWNSTVGSTIFMFLYVLVHILLSGPSRNQGLEFNGLDLPDTLGELVTAGIIVLQGQRVLNMISHFIQARTAKGSDHGVKAKSDGWLLTVALIEGENLASVDPDGFSDPYVVFTCNGKTKTSSVKLQTHNPQWKEILEFDAMEEPPSVLDVEVFDFDGPFDHAGSLGHAEVNFLKLTSAELADLWVSLEGKLAQASQTRLHLRIFLENTKGEESIREYLRKMEKEVGKKLNVHSPYKNSTFQKLFGLPPEEFLINDFSCSLKRKLPLQIFPALIIMALGLRARPDYNAPGLLDLEGNGCNNLGSGRQPELPFYLSVQIASLGSHSVTHLNPKELFPLFNVGSGRHRPTSFCLGRLFLSSRIIGFYANLFGHKTKFFFLWEDIEAIEIVPPSLASMGSPSLVIILHKGRGFDAKHYAKTQDEDGRLKFLFQSFVSFNIASRTIMALWRTRTLTADQKAKIADDQQDQDESSLKFEDTETVVGVEDANMSKVYSAEISVSIHSLMEMFDGGHFDRKVMGKVGCLNYTVTPWECVSSNVFERHLSYKFYRYVSIFGGEVTSKQRKTPLVDGNGWIVEEVMTLHDVPFGDHFRVHLRYRIEASHSIPETCKCNVYVRIAWLKSTKFQKRIARNISEKFSCRLKEIFELAGREILLANPRENVV